MKSKLRSLADVKVGLTIFIGLVIFMFLLFVVGTEQNIFTSTYTVNLFVTDLKDVVTGSMVTLGGLKVGRVEKMEFTRKDDRNGIVISMAIKKDYQGSITTSSTAVIKSIGMLGDKYIDISFGERGAPIEDNGYIGQRSTLDLSEAADSLQVVLRRFSGILGDVDRVTSSVASGRGTAGRLLMDTVMAHDLETSVRSLREITNAIGQKSGSLGKLIYDEQLYRKLTQTADNLHSLTDSIRSGSGSLGRLVRDDSLYTAMHRLAESLTTIVGRATSDSSSVGSLLNSDEFSRKLSALVTQLNSLVDEMKADPKKFFHISVF